MKPRMSRPRAFAPDPDAPGCGCEVPGCTAAGEYRAPRSRRALREWHWFCLEHVRAYNAAWDYYRGMSPGQIEAELRSDISWQRPTWPLGRLGGRDWRNPAWLEEPLASLGGRASRAPRTDAAPAELKAHLATLELGWPVTLEALKARYKELAKRHHPDANGGDRSAEERLKTINLAYATLRTRLGRAASLAAG
jgi:DnaJ domain